MSYQAMAWATVQKLPSTQKLVLLMLANRINRDTGKCVPSIKLLAEDCGLSESCVQRTLKKLVDIGLVKAHARFNDGIQLPNQYEIILEPISTPSVPGTPPGIPDTPPRCTSAPQGVAQERTEPGSLTSNRTRIPPVSPKGESPSEQKSEKDNCPHQQIVDLYHEMLPSATHVRCWTSKRRRALKARWDEDKKRQNLDWWRRLFEYIATCDFLMGRVHSQGKPPFEISLPWIVNEENLAKIIEGNYEPKLEAA